MNSSASPNIIFAIIIGVAIVSGVVVYTNLSDRIARVPSISPTSSIPQELPDLDPASMREDIRVADDELSWLATVPEQNAPQINIRTSVGGTYEPASTITRQFGVDIFRATVQASADNLSAEEFDAKIQSLSQEYTEKTKANIYTGADIRTVPATSDEVLRTYFNNLADIFIVHSPQETRGRVELFSAILKNRDSTAAIELRSIAQSYERMRNDYLNEPVPHDLVTAHVALINAVETLRNDFAIAANTANDPLAGQLAIQRYIYHRDVFTRALQNMGLEVVRYQNVFDFEEDSALLFVLTLPEE